MAEIKIPLDIGQSMMAYIAEPAVTPAPAIIMIQEIFGVNQEMRDKCDHMAGLGYVAISPDLFWRIQPGIQLIDSDLEQLQRAFDLFGQFDIDQGVKDLAATLSFIRNYESCNGLAGAVGYCLGGKLAYLMATRTDSDANVGYYGVAIDEALDEAVNIQKPLLLHLAGEDEFVPPEAQEKIRSEFRDRPLITVYSYPGVQHAFAREGGMHYDQQAAQKANDRTYKFLEETLKEPEKPISTN